MPRREPFGELLLENERKSEAMDSDMGKLLTALGNAGIPMTRNPVVSSQMVPMATPDIWYVTSLELNKLTK